MNANNKFYFFNHLNSSLIHDFIYKNIYSYLLSLKGLNI